MGMELKLMFRPGVSVLFKSSELGFLVIRVNKQPFLKHFQV